MMGRRMVVRRRPLLRAAAIGGTFAAGRASGRRADEQASAEAEQDQRLSAVEQNQATTQNAAPAADQGGTPSVTDQLNQLTTLHQQGSLTDDEFAAAKAQILR
jgi:hypothetical protein